MNCFPKRKIPMNKLNVLADRIALGLGVVLLAGSMGCIVPVGGGGYYGGDVVVPGPPVVFDDGFDRGRDVHVYSERGVASRAVAHPVERHVEAPHGGGEEKRR
jgi:hypothetical protein